MKIKFVTGCVGASFSYAGNREYDVADEAALGFLKCGLAVPVRPEVRTAVLPSAAVETAVATTPGKGRKK